MGGYGGGMGGIGGGIGGGSSGYGGGNTISLSSASSASSSSYESRSTPQRQPRKAGRQLGQKSSVIFSSVLSNIHLQNVPASSSFMEQLSKEGEVTSAPPARSNQITTQAEAVKHASCDQPLSLLLFT